MASIEEVWGTGFARRPQPLSSKSNIPEHRDAQKEGRVYASPQERSAASITAHRKDIDDLSKTLPIVKTDEEASRNFPGTKFTPMASASPPITHIQEAFTPAYAPPGFQSEHRLNEILRKMEQDKSYGSEANVTQDMMLYIFTGIVYLFTLDSFVNMGRRMRR